MARLSQVMRGPRGIFARLADTAMLGRSDLGMASNSELSTAAARPVCHISLVPHTILRTYTGMACLHKWQTKCVIDAVRLLGTASCRELAPCTTDETAGALAALWLTAVACWLGAAGCGASSADATTLLGRRCNINGPYCACHAPREVKCTLSDHAQQHGNLCARNVVC